MTRRLVESVGGVLLWPCREIGLDAAVAQRDNSIVDLLVLGTSEGKVRWTKQ